jgi:CRP/FNR family nitrogen fixation transcriptional regulator
MEGDMLQAKSTMAPRDAANAAVGAPGLPYSCAKGCRFFERCETKSATALSGGPLVRFKRNQQIYADGAQAGHSFKIVEGAVRLSRILADGHRQVLDILMPGARFGIELTDTYGATAEALGDVVVLRCPRACIARRSEEGHYDALIAMLSASLSATQDHVTMLGHQGAKERVASYLMRLMHVQNGEENQPLDVAVGRQDMADYLGLTIETTCRTLSNFRTAHVISMPKARQITVRNTDRLEDIAGGLA